MAVAVRKNGTEPGLQANPSTFFQTRNPELGAWNGTLFHSTLRVPHSALGYQPVKSTLTISPARNTTFCDCDSGRPFTSFSTFIT